MTREAPAVTADGTPKRTVSEARAAAVLNAGVDGAGAWQSAFVDDGKNTIASQLVERLRAHAEISFAAE